MGGAEAAQWLNKMGELGGEINELINLLRKGGMDEMGLSCGRVGSPLM